MSLEELGAFEKRFLGGNTRGGEGLWEKEVARWLGVRWAAKEALYKAYPYPYWWLWEGEGTGGRGGSGGRLTWKEVTMRVDGVSGEFALLFLFASLVCLWGRVGGRRG